MRGKVPAVVASVFVALGAVAVLTVPFLGATVPGASSTPVSGEANAIESEYSSQQFAGTPVAIDASWGANDLTAIQSNDRFEPNDAFDEATELEGGFYSDLQIVEGESDFFAVQLAEGETLTATIYFNHGDGDLDLAAYDPDQNQLDSSESVTDGEEVSVTAEASGTYYVEAYGFAGDSAPYDLELTIEGTGVTARCTVSPETVSVGEEVTIDASESENADSYEYDRNGDGTFDTDRLTQTLITHSYDQPGEYTPRVRAYSGDQTDITECGTVQVEGENEPPTAEFDWDPDPAIAGEPTTLDASNSTDPDGNVVEYRWDFNGDGDVDRNATDPVTTYEFAYDETGTGYAVVDLTVVDDEGATGRTVWDVPIVRSPTARCTVSPETVEVGEEVTIDASESENTSSYEYDRNGDGTFDTDRLTQATITHSYDQPGEYTPRVRAYGEEQTTDTADCGPIQVEGENEPPTAEFDWDPDPAIAGEPTTLDASNSVDSDGNVAEYRWDFNGDGDLDRNTTDPVTTYEFAYDETGTGYAVVDLTVVDDEGATDRTGRDIPIVRSPTARCFVSPETARTGEEVTIDASESENGDLYRFDFDGDGDFDTDWLAEPVQTTTYGESSEYTPVVEVANADSEEIDTAECGPVQIEGGNEPPIAAFDYDPGGPKPDESVTFDASASVDPDGSIVEYRWDFDNDGDSEVTTTDPVVNHSFDTTGNKSVVLVVVDDDDATDSQRRIIEVVSPRDPGSPWDLPGPPWLLPGAGTIVGGGAGYVLGRRRCGDFIFGGGSSASGIVAHATGTFETPTGSGSVAVTGLDFEPDLVLFTATNNATADGRELDRTDGWTYGKAKLADEEITQNTVSVANDARRTDAAVVSSRSDVALDILVHDDDRASGLLGTVEGATPDGFEVTFDDSAVPADHAEESYVVGFQAFECADDADIDVGFFTTPGRAAVQTVDLETDADYVAVTATDPLGKMNAAEVTDERIGVSHGVAAREEAIRQHVVGGAVEPAGAGYSSHAAFDDRAIHLVHGRAGEIDGRTAARVTHLGEYLELTYDEVYDETGDGATGATTQATPQKGGADGNDEPGAPPRLVTYVAVDTGEGQAPNVGHFELLEPGEGPTRIDVGFEPSVVDFTVSPADGIGERTVAADPRPFGWSHGAAMIDPAGTVHHYALHNSIGGDRAAGSGPIETPPTGDPSTESGAVGRDGGTPTEEEGGGAGHNDGLSSREGESPGAAAIVLAVDDAGRILGRDELRVTGVDRTGFEVETERVGPERERTDDRRRVVFYTAWAGEENY